MDNLAVELEIIDEKATIKIDSFKSNLKLVSDDIKAIGGDRQFAGKLTTDLGELSKRAEAVHKSFQDIISQRLDAGQIGAFSKEIVNASQRSRQLAGDIINIRKELANPNRKSSIAFLTEELLGAERELDQLQRKLQTVRSETSASKSESGSEFTQGLIEGLEIPIERAAIGALLGYQAFSIGKDSIQKIKEARNAQLALKSATIETGLSYQFLTQQARKFADQNLQSDAEAQQAIAQITNFANAAARSDKLDLFRQRLSDLAAAKGVDPTNLGEIAKQLNALTDEATDKLLGANPSAFYDKFAKSIGKTADSLTDAEKRAAVFDEVLRRGALFEGTAEKKANDVASSIDKLTVKFNNAKTAIGEALVPLVDFTDKAIDFITANQKLYVSDEEKETRRSNQRIFDQKKVDETVKSLRDSDAKIRAALANPLGSLENFALSRVNIATGFVNEGERKKAIEKATEEAQKFVDSLQKRLELAINSGDPVLAKLAKKEFSQFANLFDPETREKFIKGFSAVIAQSFQQAITEAQNNVPKLRRTLQDVFASSDLTRDAKSGLIAQIDRQITQLVESGKAKVKELGKQFEQTFDGIFLRANAGNPFVQLFSEADKALETLRQNTRGLSKDLIKTFEEMDSRTNSLKLFETRLNNRLSAFDLRDSADNFRNFKAPRSAEEIKREQDDIVERFLRQNPNYLYLAGKTEVDDVLRRDILSRSSRGRATLETVNPYQSLQDRIEKQLSIIYGGRLNKEELGIADRRFISLTNSLNPNELTYRIREAAAAAREREADRLDSAERDAKLEREKSFKVQEQIRDELKKLNKIAENEGIQGVIRIIDETNGKVETKLGKRAGQKETRELFGQ